jgi:hypothetical protein
MSKQTAVEWLIQSIVEDQTIKAKSMSEWNMVYEQAKAMEKEQMIDFAQKWEDSPLERYDCKEDLYNQTYK